MPRQVIVEITPGVLDWAIRTSGLSRSEVADQCGVELTLLNDWLHGDDAPTAGELKKLANVLKRPVSAFLLPYPPEVQAPEVAFRHPVAGARTKLTPKELVQLRDTGRMQRALSWVRQELGRDVIPLPHANIASDAEVQAGRVRALLGTTVAEQLSWADPSEAFRAWRRSFEEFGIYVFWLPMGGESARGFSLWDEHAPIIAANTHWNIEARIFTVAHELGHLATRTSSVCLGATTRKSLAQEDAMERWCEAFAAAFLLPWDAVISALQENVGLRPGERVTTIEQLRLLARPFKVSLRAAALRLINKQAAAWSLYDAIPQWSDSKDGGGGGGAGRNRQKLYEDWFGKATARTFMAALDEDLISRPDVLSYLRVSDSDLYRMQAATP